MIHKFWTVRLSSSDKAAGGRPKTDANATDEERNLVRIEEEKMEEKVYRIWSILSTFEESSAACISDMLLHVSNGAYMEGVTVAKKFIWHVDILFGSLDRLHHLMISEGVKGTGYLVKLGDSWLLTIHLELSYGREAKLLCKKIVAFFSLLSKSQDTGVRKLGVTQELLSLVTGLAHYLKLLIRISLQGALRLERERKNADGLHRFLDELNDLDSIKDADRSLDSTAGVSGLAEDTSDRCAACKAAIEDECVGLKERRWHKACLICSNCGQELGKKTDAARWSDSEHRVLCQTCAEKTTDAVGGFENISKLQQYVFLLRVALARLLARLRSSGALPHTSGMTIILDLQRNLLTFIH